MRCLASNVVLLALAALQPSFAAAKRRHLRRRNLPSDLDDARETDDTIEWDDTTIEDDTRVVGQRWRRRPYGVIDDDGWAGDGEPVDPGAELALVLFLVIVIFWLAVGSAFAPRQRYTGATRRSMAKRMTTIRSPRSTTAPPTRTSRPTSCRGGPAGAGAGVALAGAAVVTTAAGASASNGTATSNGTTTPSDTITVAAITAVAEAITAATTVDDVNNKSFNITLDHHSRESAYPEAGRAAEPVRGDGLGLRQLRDGGHRAGEASHAPRPDRPDGRDREGDERGLGRFSEDRAHAFREHAFRRRLSEE